jgi:hypothetical protein
MLGSKATCELRVGVDSASLREGGSGVLSVGRDPKQRAYTRCPSSQSHRRSGRCPSSQSHRRSGHQFATLPAARGSGGGAWEIRVRGGRLAKREGWVPAELVARALRVPAELVARPRPSLHVERRPLRRRGTKTVGRRLTKLVTLICRTHPALHCPT